MRPSTALEIKAPKAIATEPSWRVIGQDEAVREIDGLWDAVYDRVTVGHDRGALRATTTMEPAAPRSSCSSRCATGCVTRTSSTTA